MKASWQKRGCLKSVVEHQPVEVFRYSPLTFRQYNISTLKKFQGRNFRAMFHRIIKFETAASPSYILVLCHSGHHHSFDGMQSVFSLIKNDGIS